MADDRVRETGPAEDDAGSTGTDAFDAQGADAAVEADPYDDQATEWRSWSNLWQVPAIVVSTVLILAGLWYAMPAPEAVDYDARLDVVADHIAGNRLPEARAALQQEIEPRFAAQCCSESLCKNSSIMRNKSAGRTKDQVIVVKGTLRSWSRADA